MNKPGPARTASIFVLAATLGSAGLPGHAYGTESKANAATLSEELLVPDAPQLGTASQYLSRTPEENDEIISRLTPNAQLALDKRLADGAQIANKITKEVGVDQGVVAASNKRVADQIMFSNTLPQFIAFRAYQYKKFPQFNWRTDLCSAPWWTRPINDKYSTFFQNSCVRHDFGYRNYGSRTKLKLAPNESNRQKIDDWFLADMRGQVASSAPARSKRNYYSAAVAFHDAVRNCRRQRVLILN